MRFKNTFQVLGCKGFKGNVEGVRCIDEFSLILLVS